MKRILLLLSAAAAFVALAFAAADRIELAGYAFCVAIMFIAAAGIVALYLRLPDDERSRVISQPVIRTTAWTSLALAVFVSCVSWFVGWIPLDVPDWEPLIRHWRKLDFIPSAFSPLLPAGWRSGFHQYFRSGTYCFPGPPWWESMRYLRTAIPAYALMFFSVIVLLRLAARGIAVAQEKRWRT